MNWFGNADLRPVGRHETAAKAQLPTQTAARMAVGAVRGNQLPVLLSAENAPGSICRHDCVSLHDNCVNTLHYRISLTAVCALPQPHGRLQIHVGMLRRRRDRTLRCCPAPSDAVLPVASAAHCVRCPVLTDVRGVLLCTALSTHQYQLVTNYCIWGFAVSTVT